MKIFITILLGVHGLLHLPGFLRAYHLALEIRLGNGISKINGIVWLLGAISFLATAVLFLLELPSWWFFSAVSVLLSQYAIMTNWQEAKTGTFVNILIVAVTIAYIMLYQVSQMSLNMQV